MEEAQIFALCWLQVKPDEDRAEKPGRQVTAFLFFFNLAQWLVISFEIQKV